VTSRRSDSGLDGILLVDKPAGWTSHDVVARARRLTGQRRIGHTGTLDPMATGLLVLCLGRATRLVEFLTGHTKRYTGVIRLGRTTTTDDAEGETLAEAPVPELGPVELEAALGRFRGVISQLPPSYSALKIGGKRAYALARRGETPAIAPRRVRIDELSGTLLGTGDVGIDVTCSAGTYVRSLARDLGAVLGCGAHLSALRRESAGPFLVARACTLGDLERAVANDALTDLVLPADEGVTAMDAAILGAEGAGVVAHGGAWTAATAPGGAAEPIRIYAESGEFVGVGSLSSLGEIRASKVFLRQNSAD